MSSAKKLALALGDIAILYISLGITLLIRYSSAALPRHFGDHLVPFSLIFIVWLLVFYLADLYRQKAFRGEQALEKTFASAVLIAGLSSVILFYLFGDFFRLTPKTNLALFIIIFGLLDDIWRRIFSHAALREKVPIVVIGNSPRIEETASYLSKNPHAGYKIVEWIRSVDQNALN